MRERAVQYVLDNMYNSKDPIEGAVLEKNVKVPFEDFCTFLLITYKNIAIEAHVEAGTKSYLFYYNNGLIGTYVPYKKLGCFGGIRIGSKNPLRKTADSYVKNPFKFDNGLDRNVLKEKIAQLESDPNIWPIIELYLDGEYNQDRMYEKIITHYGGPQEWNKNYANTLVSEVFDWESGY